MNTKVLVCCHKKDICPSIEPYSPIHLGKALHVENDLGYIGDNTGDNISIKNQTYCELTGIYWAWKNLKDVDAIGLCHYRRYFDFHNQCRRFYRWTFFNTKDFPQLDLSIPNDVLTNVNKGIVYVTSPESLNTTVYGHYCIEHMSDDIRKVERIIKQSGDESYMKAFNKVMHHSNKLIGYNMFIMRWDLFDRYCKWTFALLNKLENQIDITNYDDYQKRAIAFIGERLLGVWLEANRITTINKKLIMVSDIENNNNHLSNMKKWLKKEIGIQFLYKPWHFFNC